MSIKFIYCLFVSVALVRNSKEPHQGVVIVHTYFVGSDDKAPSLPTIAVRILYVGNKSIQEVPLINFTSDSTGEKSSVSIKHFSYLDLDKNLCVDYQSFSDTAKILKKYFSIDSIRMGGGWNHFSNKNPEYEKLTTLSDTTIESISYRRFRMIKKSGENEIYLDLYTNCRRQNTSVKIFKGLSDSLGCPIVRDDTFVKRKLFMIRELQFVSDELSPQELKVFQVWGETADRIFKER